MSNTNSAIKTVAIIGAGQMGGGIAQVSAAVGYKTILYDSNPANVEKSLAFINVLLSKGVEKGKITESDKKTTLSNLSKASSITDISKADLVIEAIVENFNIKKSLFHELDKVIHKSCLIASNTSSISITKLASTVSVPENFIGMHFMNPVPVMQLVEVIKGLQTSEGTYKTICEVSKQMGKVAVLGVDSPGFVVNRILVPMINEAIFLLQEGVNPEDIDTAMKLGTNQPMGPLALADFVGLDTLLSILQILHRELGEDKYRPCPLLINYVDAGWYGKKSGRGFYKY